MLYIVKLTGNENEPLEKKSLLAVFGKKNSLFLEAVKKNSLFLQRLKKNCVQQSISPGPPLDI